MGIRVNGVGVTKAFVVASLRVKRVVAAVRIRFIASHVTALHLPS